MKSSLDDLAVAVREVAVDAELDLDFAMNRVMDEAVEGDRLSGPSEEKARFELTRKLTGFGFLQPFLDDENVEEVWINQPGQIWFAESGIHKQVSVSFTNEELKSLIERMIRSSGRRIDRSTPFIDAQLESGFRLHAVIPDITRQHMSVNIRKFSKEVITIQGLLQRGMLTLNQAEFLVRELKAGANLLISGATQAGKTTLLTALLSALEPSERVVSVEDTFELRCLLPDWVAMQTRPASIEGKYEIDLRRLVKESLRMRPTRLVVGEVRGAEALDMLIAMNSGIPGLCTIHANSNQEALKKLTTLPLLAGGNISSDFVHGLVRTSMKILVHCSRSSNGKRSVSSIMVFGDADSLTLSEVQL